MILRHTRYAYNDLTIVPKELSKINSRSQCDAFVDGMLPIFTAPMSTVVNHDNIDTFKKNGIMPIIPRNIDLIDRDIYLGEGNWVAYSLNEFKEVFCDYDKSKYLGEKITNEELDKDLKVCIDIANGHMTSLYEAAKLAKELSYKNNYNLIIMTGNIANPFTYKLITDDMRMKDSEGHDVPVIDYIRVGIGGGAGCITSSNTGVHYPMASLIHECCEYRNENIHNHTKIIADGGIRNYSDVIKALALGADYVMIGSVLASLLESAAPKYYLDDTNSQHYINIDEYTPDMNLYADFYGMASRQGQIDMLGKKVKTSEGTNKVIPVKYTVEQWCTNMRDYLKSAMSYCGAKTLNNFIGKQNLVINSPAEIAAVNK